MILTLPRPDIDPRALAKAVAPGRVRGIATDILAAARAAPTRARGILRDGVRAARALHSRERRLVADAIYDVIRHEALLARAMGRDDADALWLGWMVWLGADPHAVEGLDASPATRLDTLPDDLDDRSLVALAGSVPASVADELLAAYGRAGALAFLSASAARAPLVVRVHPRRSRDAVLTALREAGVAAEATPLSPHGIRLPPGTDVARLPGLAPGDLEVHDEASQLVAPLLAPQAGLRVLDLCAGAGGKTLHLAALAPDAELWATDVRSRPLQELTLRARQARAQVRVVLPGAASPALRDFDAVLVDAPCAGTGTWRRHPELRWRLGALPSTHAAQAAVLDAAVAALRPGGRLVYATCSVLPSENEAQVEAALARHPGLRREPPDAPAEAVVHGYVRTAPHTHGTDGFFAATLRYDP